MRRAWIAGLTVLGAVLLAGCGQEAGQSPPTGTTYDVSSRGPAAEIEIGYSDDLDRQDASVESGSAEMYVASRPRPASDELRRGVVTGRKSARASREADTVRPEKTDRTETITPERRPPARRPERRIQSGTLTAGSFDDIARFDDFQRFLSKAARADTCRVLPDFPLGQRVMIHVSDEQGQPVSDARVVVREYPPHGRQRPNRSRQQTTTFDLPTGTDGRTMFLTGLDSNPGAGKFSVTVHPPDGSEPVEATMRADASPWRITLPGSVAKAPTRLDLALVIDTTGSMGDELEYLKVEIDAIAQSVYEMFPNVDQRYSLIVYRDDGDAYVTRAFDFTESLEGFRTILADQSASGGGDYPEALDRALELAGELDWRGGDTARVLFLLGDAPPHDAHAGQAIEAVQTLRAQGVRIFPVASSGVKFKAEFVMRAASFLTLGQYLFLTDHSGVGNPHAEPHVPDYRVEHLNRLMIRMISSELCGRRLGPEEIIAFEQGKLQPEFGRLQTRRGYQSTNPGIDFSGWREVVACVPRWMMLAALLTGICIVDSLSRRSS